jgi:hypothetical protein
MAILEVIQQKTSPESSERSQLSLGNPYFRTIGFPTFVVALVDAEMVRMLYSRTACVVT